MKSISNFISESFEINEAINDNIFWKIIADIKKANHGTLEFDDDEQSRKVLKKVFKNNIKKALEFRDLFGEKAFKVQEFADGARSDDDREFQSWDLVLHFSNEQEFESFIAAGNLSESNPENGENFMYGFPEDEEEWD